MKPQVFAWLCFLAVQTSGLAVELRIERKIQTEKAIQGYLFVDDKPICYTLELPAVGNITSVSSIPAGKYEGVVRRDGKLGWRIELKGVPNREHIEIHVGNYTSESTGCTLVGTAIDIQRGTVLHSADAMAAIRASLEASEDKKITVIYVALTESK